MNHQELVEVMQKELYSDDTILALVLCGSVARHEEKPNSDIDLLVINNKSFYQLRQIIRNGIKVELIETPLENLKNRGMGGETVTGRMLADGIILFDKTSEIENLIAKAKDIVKESPPIPSSHNDELWVSRKRREITEIYHDLLNAGDEIHFNYIASSLMSSAIPLLFENNKWWFQPRKKTLDYLKSQYMEYKNIETLLNPVCSLAEKRNAAKLLVETVLKPHGGILEGDAVLIKFDI